ncbi:MAG: thymidylate kinase [Clostridia bacterium]|nr:thymidylate kinase [Clostridia bacterium]
MIIDIEGTDGCGKATQTKMLFDYLCGLGKKCKIVSFPNYESASSGPVKMYLNGDLGANNSLTGYQTSSLYAVDRLATMRQINIKDYDYILLDRYVPSNMIHQSTRIEDEEELQEFLAWLVDFEYGKLRLPEPDVVLFLDVPVEISSRLAHERAELKNGMAKDILEADDGHLAKAYAKAKFVANKYCWRTIKCDANNNILSKEEIHEKIKHALNI